MRELIIELPATNLAIPAISVALPVFSVLLLWAIFLWIFVPDKPAESKSKSARIQDDLADGAITQSEENHPQNATAYQRGQLSNNGSLFGTSSYSDTVGKRHAEHATTHSVTDAATGRPTTKDANRPSNFNTVPVNDAKQNLPNKDQTASDISSGKHQATDSAQQAADNTDTGSAINKRFISPSLPHPDGSADGHTTHSIAPGTLAVTTKSLTGKTASSVTSSDANKTSGIPLTSAVTKSENKSPLTFGRSASSEAHSNKTLTPEAENTAQDSPSTTAANQTTKTHPQTAAHPLSGSHRSDHNSASGKIQRPGDQHKKANHAAPTNNSDAPAFPGSASTTTRHPLSTDGDSNKSNGVASNNEHATTRVNPTENQNTSKHNSAQPPVSPDHSIGSNHVSDKAAETENKSKSVNFSTQTTTQNTAAPTEVASASQTMDAQRATKNGLPDNSTNTDNGAVKLAPSNMQETITGKNQTDELPHQHGAIKHSDDRATDFEKNRPESTGNQSRENTAQNQSTSKHNSAQPPVSPDHSIGSNHVSDKAAETENKSKSVNFSTQTTTQNTAAPTEVASASQTMDAQRATKNGLPDNSTNTDNGAVKLAPSNMQETITGKNQTDELPHQHGAIKHSDDRATDFEKNRPESTGNQSRENTADRPAESFAKTQTDQTFVFNSQTTHPATNKQKSDLPKYQTAAKSRHIASSVEAQLQLRPPIARTLSANTTTEATNNENKKALADKDRIIKELQSKLDALQMKQDSGTRNKNAKNQDHSAVETAPSNSNHDDDRTTVSVAATQPTFAVSENTNASKSNITIAGVPGHKKTETSINHSIADNNTGKDLAAASKLDSQGNRHSDSTQSDVAELSHLKLQYQEAADKLLLREIKVKKLQSTVNRLQAAGLKETDQHTHAANGRELLLNKVRVLSTTRA